MNRPAPSADSRTPIGPATGGSGHALPVVLLLAALAALQFGCSSQEVGGPVGLVIAAETRPAVVLSDRLPLFPRLVEAARVTEGSGDDGAFSDSQGERWVRRWERSWIGEEAEEGVRIREELYREVAPVLSARVGRGLAEMALEEVENAVRLARAAAGEHLPPSYAELVEEGADFAEEARREFMDGPPSGDAVVALLSAADRLRRIEPRGVATDLIRRAEAARESAAEERRGGEERAKEGKGREEGNKSPREVGAEGESDETEAESDEDARSDGDDEEARIERLIRGARSALNDGNFELAIRRGYYACRLLGVELP